MCIWQLIYKLVAIDFRQRPVILICDQLIRLNGYRMNFKKNGMHKQNLSKFDDFSIFPVFKYTLYLPCNLHSIYTVQNIMYYCKSILIILLNMIILYNNPKK